jgi:putative drug exporter of the RND superfamily
MNKFSLNKLGTLFGGPKSRFVTVGIWLALVAVLGLVFPQINSVENYAGEDIPEEMMSRQAAKIVSEQFPSDSGIPLLIVWFNEQGLSNEDITNIQALYANLAENPTQGQLELPPFHQMPPQALAASVSENGKSLVTPVFYDKGVNTETLKGSLAEITKVSEAIFGEDLYTKEMNADNLLARYSGPVAISVDATDLFKSADFKLMVATVILILVLLLIIYRSPILAIIPIIVVSIAFLVVSPILGAFADQGWINKDAQAVAIMIVLLFGAGTDYCLFLITRYRDILLEEENKFFALAKAFKESAGAIAMSGLTVVIGLAALGLADYGAFQRFAVPFSVGVLLTGVAVLTLLPAVLALLGRAAFWPVIPRTEEMDEAYAAKRNKQVKVRKENHRYMRKVGEFATNKAWLVILISGALLIGLAIASTQAKYNYDLLSSFPEEMSSREGFALIEENFTPGELAPVQVLVDTEGQDVNIIEQLKALPYVSLVKEVRVGQTNPNIQLYELDLNKNPYSNEAMEDVDRLKGELPTILADAGLKNAEERFFVGGETSAQIDTRDVQERDESIIQPVIIIVIFTLLLVYLRAVVTSIQLMLTVLVSFFAAIGAGWLIIHYVLGHDSMSSSIPLYSFVFIIALGNDYNIFMISDIWKNRRKNKAHKKSISDGVASTGAVITSAGLILAGTFGVLASLPIQLLVQFGIVTAAGILIDTFIVRPLLVPAILTVFGKWSYWPGKLWKKPTE